MPNPSFPWQQVKLEAVQADSEIFQPQGILINYQNTGVGSLSGLQGIFPTQRSNVDRTAGRFFTICSSNHFLLAPEVPNSQPEKFQNCGMNPCVLNPY